MMKKKHIDVLLFINTYTIYKTGAILHRIPIVQVVVFNHSRVDPILFQE